MRLAGAVGQSDCGVVERLEVKVARTGKAWRPRDGRPRLENNDRAGEPLHECPELVGLEAAVQPEYGGLSLVERLREGSGLGRLQGPDSDAQVLLCNTDGHRAVSRQHLADARLRGVHRLGHVRMIGWVGRPGPAGDRQRPDRLHYQGAALNHRVRHSPNSSAPEPRKSREIRLFQGPERGLGVGDLGLRPSTGDPGASVGATEGRPSASTCSACAIPGAGRVVFQPPCRLRSAVAAPAPPVYTPPTSGGRSGTTGSMEVPQKGRVGATWRLVSL